MSTPNMFWFHCGRCGSLFESQAGDLESRLCTKCGADPSTGLLHAPAEPVTAHGSLAEETEDKKDRHEGRVENRGKRSGKRRKNRHFMLKLVGGWTLVLALIIFGARTLWRVEPDDARPDPITTIEAPAGNEEDISLLNENANKCLTVFSGFLAAGTPEERNQFVLTPVTTASRMARFYTLNPLINIDPTKLRLAGNALLNIPGTRSIETRWQSEDGRVLDAVFREENNEWRLDWDHFARYSDYPWALFLAGSGEDEGEFRLLARERLAEERKDSETISLVLYAPRFGHPLDPGFQSPEFLVSRHHREGQLLDAAFKLATESKQVFGAQLPENNPEGMIRVRVKVRRTQQELGRKFEITEVKACHWYSIDDPGVEPAAKPKEKPDGE